MTTGSYRVDEVEDAGDAACTCENCGWEGPASLTVDIGDCALTPGDASPVGRCPDCDSLAYLDAPLYSALPASKEEKKAAIIKLQAFFDSEMSKGAEEGLAAEIAQSLINEIAEDGPNCLKSLPPLKQALLEDILD